MSNPNESARLGRVWRVYERIIELDQLEDRREYEIDQHCKMYGFTLEEGTYLYKLIQADFDPKTESLYRSHWEPEDAMDVAVTLTESIHENFDGWEDHEKAIIKLYLHDISRAMWEIKQAERDALTSLKETK
jgi:uncharacterized protein YcgL (UPF0745 family)